MWKLGLDPRCSAASLIVKQGDAICPAMFNDEISYRTIYNIDGAEHKETDAEVLKENHTCAELLSKAWFYCGRTHLFIHFGQIGCDFASFNSGSHHVASYEIVFNDLYGVIPACDRGRVFRVRWEHGTRMPLFSSALALSSTRPSSMN